MRTGNQEKFSLFETAYAGFEWDERKRLSNFEKHGIDFLEVIPAFDNPMARMQSDRNDEIRYLVIGDADGREIAVAYKEETGNVCRIISARPARRDERAAYRALLARRD